MSLLAVASTSFGVWIVEIVIMDIVSSNQKKENIIFDEILVHLFGIHLSLLLQILILEYFVIYPFEVDVTNNQKS